MDKQILKKFCGSPTDAKLSRPWSLGGFTYASNGYVLIKVPRVDDIPENPEAPNPNGLKLPNAKEWFPVAGFKHPKKEKCDACNGVGKNFRCYECKGTGFAEPRTDYNTYEVDCYSCDGTGKIDECPDCNGVGYFIKQVPVNFQGVKFDRKYLSILSELPNCSLSPVSRTGINPFKFDGGTGILMPMRWE